MDLPQFLLSPLSVSFSFFFVGVLILKALKNKSHGHPPLPPSPWRLPLLGHLHHLVGKLPHQALHDLAGKHGPVFRLKIGEVDAVSVSSREAALEVLKTQDLDTASRPEYTVGRVALYGCTDVFFSPYGSYWRQARKICTAELLSAKRVRSFAAIREEEIAGLVKEISLKPPPASVNLSEKFRVVNANIISRAAVGRIFESHNDFTVALREILEAFIGFSFPDLFPSLEFLDIFFGTTRELERIRRRLDQKMDVIIKEHQVKRAASGQATPAAAAAEEDLVDVLLGIKDRGDLEIPLTFDNIKAIILDMFLGGSDTVSTALEWVMTELIRQPEAMEKAQNEVREALKGRNKVEESDAAQLNYLKLVIKETMRLHPPGPLLTRRVAKETTVLGFRVPAGGRFIINVWALGRDPRYWEEAESFKPERFDGSSVDFRGADFEYLPFGGGRRMCPGIQFSMASLELLLARLLFHFDWELPHGMRPENVDMQERFGASGSRKTDLCLLATTRIPLPSF